MHARIGVLYTPNLVCFRWVCLAHHIWCAYGDMLSTLYTVCWAHFFFYSEVYSSCIITTEVSEGPQCDICYSSIVGLECKLPTCASEDTSYRLWIFMITTLGRGRAGRKNIERYRGMHIRNVMFYCRIEVWKNGSMEQWQDGRMEAFMMEEWNGPFRLPYMCLYR